MIVEEKRAEAHADAERAIDRMLELLPHNAPPRAFVYLQGIKAALDVLDEYFAWPPRRNRREPE